MYSRTKYVSSYQQQLYANTLHEHGETITSGRIAGSVEMVVLKGSSWVYYIKLKPC